MIHRFFYCFCAIHAFLIGLLPFFIPVVLWRQTSSLPSIAQFLAASGFAYLCCLWFWDRLRSSHYSHWVIKGSFILEPLLVTSLLLSPDNIPLLPLALLNGVYGCFYWMSQRTLFRQLATDQNSGKHFGNFQILVAVLLKVGILVGALLLDSEFRLWLIPISIIVSLTGMVVLFRQDSLLTVEQAVKGKALSLKEVIQFKDAHYSRSVFFVDGFFLFLESYFWALSLYFINQENLMNLGGMVIILALIVSVLFWVLKNVIDRTHAVKLFRASLCLYLISWVVRGWLHHEQSLILQNSLIVLITFFTSFFRLSLNKAFFDRAGEYTSQKYLFIKSYYSQAGAVVFFMAMVLILPEEIKPEAALELVYYCAVILSPAYFLYHWKPENRLSLFNQKQ